MRTQQKKIRVGEIRPSALMHSFGIGSVVDLPHLSAMVMGMDDWDRNHGRLIEEQRLLDNVREKLGAQVGELRTPPEAPRTSGPSFRPFDDGARIGVPVATFPRWMVCPFCRLLAPLNSGLFALREDAFRPDRTQYVHENCTKAPAKAPAVVPARFMVACERGHLDDFPWVFFVHRGQHGCRASLRMMEFGLSGEAASVSIRCDGCGTSRPMSDAFSDEGKQALPSCRGRRPHLRDFEEDCDQPAETMLLGASGAWFAQTLTVLSIPAKRDDLPQLVRDAWEKLTNAPAIDILRAFRAIKQLPTLEAFSDEAIWREVEVQRSGQLTADVSPPDVLGPEWRVFIETDPARNTRDFKLRPVAVPAGYTGLLEQVVLVERLRAVQALIGFTRMESPDDYENRGPEDMVEHVMPLSRRPPSWAPASEVRGEGIFLRFSEQAIAEWRMRPRILVRSREFREAYVQSTLSRGAKVTEVGFPGMRYVLVHSFAHALMRQLSLECGYGAASIRERIYCREAVGNDPPMAGVLLYTSAPDSEGTLGGLVSLGEPKELGRHIEQALEAMTLCASDPLCGEHVPGDGDLTLHGAACHACLFVPETSCERGNRYLDRTALVNPVMGISGGAYFAKGTS